MKKYIPLLSLVMTFSFLSSCSDDETLNGNVSGNEISFGVSSVGNGETGTRAVPIDNSNYLTRISDFGVWAYYPGTTNYYMGSRDNEGILISHSNNQSDWGYRTATDMHYWPTDGLLDFYAVTPSSSTYYQFNNGNLIFTDPVSPSRQIDLLIAKANDQGKDVNGGKVNIAFQHALSQVCFSTIISNDNITAEIKSITLKNFYNKASYPLESPSVTGTVTSDANRADYTVSFTSGVNIRRRYTSISLTSGKGGDAIMIVPQTTSKISTDVTFSDSQNSFQYIVVECKIKQNDSYLVGSEDNYGTVNILLSGFRFENGKNYNILLDINGNNIAFKPIEMSITASDWVDADEVDVSNDHAVNLGLPSGIKWADHNVGCGDPGDFSHLYFWGDVNNSKNTGLTWNMDWTDYKWHYGTNEDTVFTKYTNNDEQAQGGKADNITTLQPDDDQATKSWGSRWRTPTDTEWYELYHYCTWTEATVTDEYNNGYYGKVRGYKVTGPNGHSIFLPVCFEKLPNDIGYMTSSLMPAHSDEFLSMIMDFRKTKDETTAPEIQEKSNRGIYDDYFLYPGDSHVFISTGFRNRASHIRAVCDK